ncbi:Fungal transcription factor regulatory middle homology region [Aspergillus mulundensis]|uniref:Fungal transcription factor regulatory middle homology region n=1 Tax=Aspergillus mulundensis TaxID=1810919 RepID=A0A3D8T6N1_9EURO|nr:Fungal transcription factor regulatory middle homology region [Aspergillus mulundensis]RDW93678.1 Fungal transcription factor regulatory middle homology region [Aspergillus mulundensis]
MDSSNPPRKACDLCYTRKLKCDGHQPRCSNCVTYARECTHAAAPRRKKPKVQRHSATQKPDNPSAPRSQYHAMHRAKRIGEKPVRREAEAQVAAGYQAADDYGHDEAIGSGAMKLPPLQEAMALVGIFLRTCNSVLPLFHTDTLLRMVGKCYALRPRQRDPVVWAAINVVFALASQHMPSASIEDGVFQHQTSRTAEYYLSKAQSVMATVMQSETRLLNIQTLLGMVMVLQTSRDRTPSLMLISATMRLVHKLGLHDRSASAHLDPVARRQHARVFWIAYILDKDLSLRAQIPSIQADDDIDIDLPCSSPVTPEDNDHTAGTVVMTDGKASMNYFLARIQLANIKGRIYTYLYSRRALNQSPLDRITARQGISLALDEWRASIPLHFSAAVITQITKNPANLGFSVVLHASSLQCMMLLSQAQGMDEQWVTGVQNYSRGVTSALQLPPCWEILVQEARAFMLLFQEVWAGAWFRWIAACPYASAAMLLAANNLLDVRHSKVDLDMGLVDAALVWLDEIMVELASDAMRRFRGICMEAVRTVKQRRAVYALA